MSNVYYNNIIIIYNLLHNKYVNSKLLLRSTLNARLVWHYYSYGTTTSS